MDQPFYNSFENFRNGNWQTFQIDTANCNGITLINRSNGGTADFNNGSFYIDAGQQLTFEGKEKEVLSTILSVRVIAATRFNLIVIKKAFI
jgi:hypothetical protein